MFHRSPVAADPAGSSSSPSRHAIVVLAVVLAAVGLPGTMVGFAGVAGAQDRDLGFCWDAAAQMRSIARAPLTSQVEWDAALDLTQTLIDDLGALGDSELDVLLADLQAQVDTARTAPDDAGGFDTLTQAEVDALFQPVLDAVDPVWGWVEVLCPNIGAGVYLIRGQDCAGWTEPPMVAVQTTDEPVTVDVAGSTTEVGPDDSVTISAPTDVMPADVVVDGAPLTEWTDVESASQGDAGFAPVTPCLIAPYAPTATAEFSCDGTGTLTMQTLSLATQEADARTYDTVDVVVDGETTTYDHPIPAELTFPITTATDLEAVTFSGEPVVLVEIPPLCPEQPSSADDAPPSATDAAPVLAPAFTG